MIARYSLAPMLVLLLASCRPAAETPEGSPPPAPPRGTSSPVPPATVPPAAREPLFAFTFDTGREFSSTQPVLWQPAAFAGVDYALPLDLDQAFNPIVLEALTQAQRSFLSANGFLVMHSQERQFYAIRERVSKFNDQPYYLTTDAAFHALHLTFDDLLKALEREALRPYMAALVRATLDETLAFLPGLQGTAIEADARPAALNDVLGPPPFHCV